MTRRNLLYFVCIILIVYLTLAANSSRLAYILYGTSANLIFPSGSPTKSIILIPLDSRPPCTQFVEQLAKMANIKLVMPPSEMLDHYKQPADRENLRLWLKNEFSNVDGAIISVDMLIHGGLLASRNAHGSSTDIAETLHLLQSLHEAYPHKELYVFSIIPRLLISDSQENAKYQKKMLKYSVLKDQINLFENPLDMKRLAELEAEIPTSIIDNYKYLYQQNLQLSYNLIALAQRGVITRLTIGQDDGYPFGLPNMTKQRLQHFVEQTGINNKVYITRGTDEVAMTMLGAMATAAAEYKPKVKVLYSEPGIPSMVMPFMPHSIARTVEEKVVMLQGIETESVEEADFVLFVHAGNRHTTPYSLSLAAKQVKTLLAQGYHVAVVDLSEDYLAGQTLLPYLLKENVDLLKLHAYAGWNTTSNSIGTALTQATIFNMGLKDDKNINELQLKADNLTFLIARYLDDWYYQKDIQPLVNAALHYNGTDSYNLGDKYASTTSLIRRIMYTKADVFLRRNILYRGFAIDTPSGKEYYAISMVNLNIDLPWERTFEILLQPRLSIVKIDKE